MGIAHISSTLRNYASDLSELSYLVISQIVKYLKLNQGGVFILNTVADEEPYLELTACCAFEPKKYINKKIAVGEGLVGQAVSEKEPVYMTDIP